MSNSEMAPSTEVSASNASDQALESQSSAHSSQKSSRKHKDIKELHAHDDPSSYENQMARKRILQKMLHEYQLAFEKEHGRPIKSTIDVAPLKNEYAEYKVIFAYLIQLLRKRLATDKNDF